VTKFPLVAGLFSLVFAVGSLFGVRELGAGITASRFTDCIFWIGAMSTSVLILALYSLLLQKLGILETSKAIPQADESMPKHSQAAATEAAVQ